MVMESMAARPSWAVKTMLRVVLSWLTNSTVLAVVREKRAVAAKRRVLVNCILKFVLVVSSAGSVGMKN